jgi:hypothetical protein
MLSPPYRGGGVLSASESYAGGSVATGRATLARQAKG